MTVALVANIARPISSAISTAFSADSYGLLSSYGLLGASANPDAVIEALFANSEVGAWYDPSDLTTMFQDRAGTTPVTADGQKVGLILDKSKGFVLGPELVVNGNPFVSGSWTQGAGCSISGGKAIFNSATAYFGQIISGGIPSSLLEFTVVVDSISSGALTVETDGAIGNDYGITSPGTYTFRRKHAGAGDIFYINSKTDPVTAVVSSVSLKQVLGNHAVAPSDAARPLKTSTGAADWTNYDAVDDVLNITFPSSLGSDCTVCRANVGSAPTILTGQTIGTSYADSTDNAGLIIINRALTGQETTDVTAWLTAKGAT